MSNPREPLLSEWNEVLEHAASETRQPDDDLCLFLEHRQDLTVTARSGGPTASVHTHWSGLCAQTHEIPQLLYRSDPTFDDALTLVDCLSERTTTPKLRARGGTPKSKETPKAGHQSGPHSDRDARIRSGAGSEPWVVSDLEAGRLLEELVVAMERKLPGISVLARWIGVDQQVRIAWNGRGVATDHRSGARLRIQARLGEAEAPASVTVETTLHDRRTGRRELLDELSERACRRVEARVDARHAKPGEYPVVFSPGVGGILVHELVGHALEADVVLAGTSWLSAAGEGFLPRELTVLDDPRRGRVRWRIDDQGQEAKATPLLRGGRVAGCLHDRRTAERSGEEATGHGRRASFRDPVLPRMGATFVAAGRLRPPEVFEGIAKGIHVRRMEAASTDTNMGRAVFRVTDADFITHGRVDYPLHPFLLLVHGEQALATVDRIAGDLALDSCLGSCHKDGQPLAISVGAPTFRVGLAKVMT